MQKRQIVGLILCLGVLLFLRTSQPIFAQATTDPLHHTDQTGKLKPLQKVDANANSGQGRRPMPQAASSHPLDKITLQAASKAGPGWQPLTADGAAAAPDENQQCYDFVQNGGFEVNAAWYGEPQENTGYSVDYAYSGQRSAYLNTCDCGSSAQIWQTITLPTNLSNLNIDFYSGLIAYDPNEVVEISFYDSASGDLLYNDYLIYPDLNSWYRFQSGLPVANLAGRTVDLVFEVAADGDNGYYTEAYFDDVALVGCEGSVTPTSVPPTSTPVPPTGAPTVIPPTTTPQPTPQPTNPGGQFETSIALRPNPDGYRFENWGGQQYDDTTDLDAGALIRMFGSANVCQSGSTANDCVLNAAARQWRSQALQAAAGGHCYGMAVGSQRFFGGLDNPANYQSGVNKPFLFNPSPTVRANITELFITQALRPADGSPDGWIRRQRKKPSEMLALIRQQLQNNPNDPYVLGFFHQAGKGGHAVTPYAIENKGGNIYWLWFYDNNWPNTPRYMIFDLNQETWRYGFGTVNPGEPVDAWEGNANTDSLVLRPTSAHRMSGWACPFCQNQVTASGSSQPNNQVEFSLLGQGQLLLIDQQEQSLGFDFNTGTFVENINGAETFQYMGGTGKAEGWLYRTPLNQSNQPYQLFVSGQTITQSVSGDLMMAGPGYVVGFNELELAPNANLIMTIRPDGKQITFNANRDGIRSPEIFLAFGRDTTGASYRFEVDGFELSAFKTVTVTLDLAQGKLYFTDDDGATDNYAVGVLRITANGQEQAFYTDQINLGSTDNAVMNFGAWNGEEIMTLQINEQTFNFNNQMRTLHLPLVVR